MHKTIGYLVTLAILAGSWLTIPVHAASPAVAIVDSDKKDASVIAFTTDDVAACADDPAPGMNGENPGFAGKPINLLSGVETYSRGDVTVGSLFPIAVSRRYDSRSGYDSPVGYGWAINYDRRIYTYPDGSVTLRKECGWKKRFTLSGGNYAAPLGETGTLVKTVDGNYTYTYKSGEKDTYDARGRLISRIAENGNSFVINYELDSRSPLWGLLPANVNQSSSLIVAYDYRLSRIEEKDASGALTNHYILFHYDSSTGRLTDIVDNTGRTVTYAHDSIGNLTGVSGPSGSVTYGYTNTSFNHRITSVDEGQGAYVNTYDTNGRVSKQTHGTGVIDFEYTTPYKKTKITTTIKDSAGTVLNTQIRTVEFDANGQVAKSTDTLGNITTYVRDSNTWILQEGHTDIVSGNTTTTAYTYDNKGNMLTKTEAQGTAIEKTTWYHYMYEINPSASPATYNKLRNEVVKSVVDPTQYRYVTYSDDDATGNLLATTETGLLGDGTPYSYTTTYGYDGVGHVTSIDGPRTDVQDITTYAYDSTTGYLTSMTQPIIGTTVYSNFDALGNPQTIIDPNGNSTTYTYDTAGRVATVKAAGDTVATQYFYVSGGCGQSCSGSNKIDHITFPEGNTITYHYDDGMGNLASIQDSQNNTINYTYDSEGNKLTGQIKDASGALQKSLSYSYDALNKLSKIINPDTTFTQYTYDVLANRKTAKDPNGNTTTYNYDALSRLASVIQPGTVTTAYGYNSNNNLTAVIDANNNATTYIYDDKGRAYQVISPDTGTTSYGYDPAGNIVSKTDAKGVTITYQYDAANRLTRIRFPSDGDYVFTYDSCVNGKGQVCSMTDASGTTVYEYTPKGQIKKEAKVVDSNQYVTQYTYDQNGNLKTMTYPSGRMITYTQNNDKVIGVLNNAANLATNIIYKPFGGMSSLTYGNELTGSISYDNQYRIFSITAGVVMGLSYDQYDANANIQHITNTLDPAKNKTFGYDALDRLTSASGSGGSLGWTYDGVGNRLTEGSNAYNYTANTNKLTIANGISFGFDNDGNTTTQGARQYIYNQNQRLIQVNDGGMTANYTYNGNGQRVKKNVNGTVTVYHYSQSGQIIAESNNAGTINVEYVYLNGQPLAMIANGNTYYYHTDNLATPQKMTDSLGAVVWSVDYKPFGEATITASSITNNLRFPGQYYDAEAGTLYNFFRDYNPAIGRYVEADPVGIAGGRNHLYVYVNSSPVNLIDPTGTECQVDVYRTEALMSSGINAGHEWIVYGQNSVGFWPNRNWQVLRPDPAEVYNVPKVYHWTTTKLESGTLKWGNGAGKKCKCATCDEIHSCLDTVPNPGWTSFSIFNNCRRFVRWALPGCCLSKN